MPSERAIFAAGCFWGVEAEFRALAGVTRTSAGYSGGSVERPSYEQVCGGNTGHAEAVEVEYDPATIGYDTLLETFWSIHDPTTRDRQGWDFASQYRSAIFTLDEDQQTRALASRDRRQPATRREIVTQIEPAGRFWPAEEYHQQYFEKSGRASCTIAAPAA